MDNSLLYHHHHPHLRPSLPANAHSPMAFDLPSSYSIKARRPGDIPRTLLYLLAGSTLGFIFGISSPRFIVNKVELSRSLFPIPIPDDGLKTLNITRPPQSGPPLHQLTNLSRISSETIPKGAERLPTGILASKSDLYLRRLWGEPAKDLAIEQRYLVAFTVGYHQRHNIDAALKKFSNNFTVVLFHYDGRTTEWDEFEWSRRAIHISVPKQTKWWYAKRFLHPDIVAPYDYIFMWDEDIGVEHFDAEKYIELVRKHELEISQPAIEINNRVVWPITIKREDSEVHREANEKPCADPLQPPCAGFVEIMAPVFTRSAWRCVWHMIQNDLVHGWGLDFSLRKCVAVPHKQIGVVDAQWIVHQHLPTLQSQGMAHNGQPAWKGVYDRCMKEWKIFNNRMEKAEDLWSSKNRGSQLNSS
ncbi:hypothetical protein MLD38_025494 [Melastoma candidum]|uniref:Uncharacterized protein n=1 Tax=Melastoma candidum TaxID=119954 RepID=A0ACB9NYN6_9MYRT|nr:hypothetical protein MLD38_025494 [Melastoma candidum]